MRRSVLAVMATVMVLAGCGGHHSSQHRYQTPLGPAAHSPTFGLPPAGVHVPVLPTAVPTVEMFDSIVVSTVPLWALATAGYTSGFWPDFEALVAAFPHAHHVSIAIDNAHRAKCLDIEPGDATPAQAGPWDRAQIARHIIPCNYTSLAEMPAVKASIAHAGLHRWQVLLWDADWTYRAHLDAGYDATQWTDRSHGRNLDESTVSYGFLGINPHPKPKPPPPKPKPPTPTPKPKPVVHHGQRWHHLHRLIQRHCVPRPHARYRHACGVWHRELKRAR